MITRILAFPLSLALSAPAAAQTDWLVPTPEPPRLELDMDGDTRVDTAAVVLSADNLRIAVQICLSSRETCDIVADTALGSEILLLGRRAPGCYDFLHEGEAPVQPRPGNMCTTNDLLTLTGAAIGDSYIAWIPEDGRFVRYWMQP